MINILGKINLENLPQEKPRFKAEKYKPFLDEKIGILSQRLNNEYGKIVNEGGDIYVDNQADKDFIQTREETWASEMNKSKEDWLRDKELNKSSLAETSVTLLLDKVLNNHFIITRSSTYDDYRNGVDNVILDKETGNVVCGFDEVLGYQGDDGGSIKAKKIQKIMEKGGVNLHQGLTFNDKGGLDIKKLTNLPAFYLSLSKDDLKNVLESLENNNETSKVEKDLVSKFVSSMEMQLQQFEDINLNKTLAKNVSKFKVSLDKIKILLNE